jgi:hypothetical protein
MPRNITAAIENLSAADTLRVVDLVKVVFPDPIGTLYWSKASYTYNNNSYVARILDVGSWKRSMSAETSDLTITLSNADGEITKIWNTVEMEFAQVSLIRYYPTLGEAIDPLWVGYGGTCKLDEENVEWNIHFGFRGMMQKAVRKVNASCWKLFNDSLYCPYNPSYDSHNNLGDVLTGLCDKLSTAITTTAETTIYVTSTIRYKANDIIKIDDELLKILSAVNLTTLTVSRGYNYTIPTTHIIDTLVKHASCSKTKQACDRRGMRGPTDFNPISWYNGYRYFGGWTDILAPYEFSYFKNGFGGVWMTSLPKGGTPSGNWIFGSQGLTIPVVYGNYRLSNIPSFWSTQIDQFIYALFLVCEGTASAVAVNTIRVNNCGPANWGPNEDSVGIWWGDIGQRRMFMPHHGIYTDTYAQPYLIANTNQDGPSLSDVLALYIRIQGQDKLTNATTDSQPSLDLFFTGRIISTVQGLIDCDATKTTGTPNPIEAAIDFCTNRKFGPRSSINKINLTKALTESAYCDANVISTDESVTAGTLVPRFKFNGAITDDKNSEAVLAAILDNCNGYYIQNDGKIEFRIRKAEDLTVIDEMKWLMDYGIDRNILRDKSTGKSTLTIEVKDGLGGYVNNVVVSFADIAANYQNSTISIYDDEKQAIAAEVSNSDFTRAINSKDLTLIGTTSLDQAQRLGVLNLREEYRKRINVTFQMSLKDSIKFAPGDIKRIESLSKNRDANKKLTKQFKYVRIYEIEETDKFTATFLAHPHFNEDYDNTPVIPET